MEKVTPPLVSCAAPLLAVATGAGAQTPPAPTEAVKAPATSEKAVRPTRSVVYKTTVDAEGKPVELALHVFEPPGHKATARTPAILFFFGGGWNGGAPTSFFPHCAYFAARGIVAIAADYRVKTRQATTPFECVADGKSAVRYLRAHSATLGIDPQRIAAAGSSAGGHVAACTGILTTFDEPAEEATVSSQPNALALYNPVIDTSAEGYGHDRLGELWREISPLHHVRAGLPPTLVVHGTADETVPYANATAFEAAMKGAGNQCRLVSLAGVGHGFAYNLAKKPARRATRETDIFLSSLGYLAGEPTMNVNDGADAAK